MNARKIYDEPNVLEGVLENKLFVGILASELALQVSLPTTYSLSWVVGSVSSSGRGYCHIWCMLIAADVALFHLWAEMIFMPAFQSVASRERMYSVCVL